VERYYLRHTSFLLKKKKLTLDAPYVRYHDFSKDGNCDMEGGFIIKDKDIKNLINIEEIKKDGYNFTHLKHGKYCKITFKGKYELLSQGWKEFMEKN